MARYWVNLGSGLKDEEADANEELQELANHFNEFGSSYVAEDLEEAKEVSKKARAIMEKRGWTEKDFWLGTGVITTQPECPECGYLARFSDEFCSKCGSKLTEKQDVE